MATTVEEFVAAFDAHVREGSTSGRLARLIEGLSFEEVERCLRAYLGIFRQYGLKDPKSLEAFASLVSAGLTRGEAHYALRVDALSQARQTVWGERFAALPDARRRPLVTRARARLRELPPAQQTFLKRFYAAVRDGNDGPVEQHVSALSFASAHGCLLAYLEASLRYANDNDRSLRIFFGVSTLVLGKGDVSFARDYLRLTRTPETTWALRWTALNDTFRKELEQQAKSVDPKERMVAAGKRAGTTPSPVFRPTPPTVGADETVRGARPATAVQRTCADLLRRYIVSKRRGPELQAFADWLGQRSLPELRECLPAFLTTSLDFPRDNVESLDAFYRIAVALLDKGDAYDASKLEFLTQASGRTAALRFHALPTERRETLSDALAARRKEARLLVPLKLAYFRRHNRDPDLAALWKHEPDVAGEHRAALRSAAQACDRSFEQRDVKRFAAAFDAFSGLVLDQRDELVLLAAVKWIREAKDVGPLLQSELYWCTVLALYRRLLARKDPRPYLDGFDDEETTFLLDAPLRSQAYRYDFEQRLACAIESRMGPEELRQVARAHAVLLLVAQRAGVTLLTMEETEDVRQTLDRLAGGRQVPRSRLRIPVTSRFGPHELEVGDTVGNAYIVWWEPRPGVAYLELATCERVLFSVESHHALGRMYDDDATYGAIWRDTQHLLVVIPFFFDVMGYIVDLTTGGLGELVRGIIVDVVVDRASKAMELDPAEATALSFLGHGGADAITNGMRGLRALDALPEVDDSVRGIARQEIAAVEPPQRAVTPASQPLTTRDVPMRYDEPATPFEPTSPAAVSRAGGAQPPPPPVGAGAPAPAPSPRRRQFEPGSEPADPVARAPADVPGGRAVDASATDARAVPPKPPDSPSGAGPEEWFYTAVVALDHPALVALQRAGYMLKFVPIKFPKSGAGALQKWLGRTDLELAIVSPTGVKVEVDIPAIDPSMPNRLVFVEVKATFVANPGQSAHLTWNAEKAQQIARYAVVAMESNGWVSRIEVATNAPTTAPLKAPVPSAGQPERFTHAADIYMSNVVQGVTTELMTRFRRQLLDYIERATGHRPKRLSRQRVEEIVETLIEVKSVDFGYVRKKKAPERPVRKQPTNRKPPTKRKPTMAKPPTKPKPKPPAGSRPRRPRGRP